ncbi:MAG: hypothetical protein XD76_1732 [candidate division TA06 bacterium 32_111]|uniref:Uncharacterized protein n=2 Tax=Bacteria candidate phyla TaxID=1783234 RepID=A0A101HZP6_UNCT6|nr:MAG: hypothetical protein XD76_1732 [candidate division TA06 bacterium 32_111]KUK85940.1 MAG: hypothetical protein XE03_1823 [candidate division TA06 bacterium 34_109]HAF07290.1 hypothetical protein [candidate division WOR-3 bacterium]HCP16476.1 hypothetical protein [candidate division WOR-3 bacterium]
MILSILLYSLIIFYSFCFGIFVFQCRDFSLSFGTGHYNFLVGFSLYLVIKFFVTPLKENINFFETFQHETTHMFFAFITFKNIYSFKASSKSGGLIKTEKINPIVALSPYTIPLFSIFFILLTFFIKEKYRDILFFFSGFFFSQFFSTTIKDTLFGKQSDLERYPLFSYIIIPISLFFFIFFFYFFITYGTNLFYIIPKSTFYLLFSK